MWEHCEEWGEGGKGLACSILVVEIKASQAGLSSRSSCWGVTFSDSGEALKPHVLCVCVSGGGGGTPRFRPPSFKGADLPKF